MRTLRTLMQLIRADFLERTRRYSFLITLGVMVYVGYLAVPSLDSGMLTVDLGNLRGVYNSAWVGSMVAVFSSMVLSLPGFYLVKNAIERDCRTDVGQIIATTPLSKPLYTLGKTVSNFIFLIVIIAVVAAAAGAMQFIRGESMRLDVWALVAPFLFTTLPTLLLVAAVAVLFETIPFLRGGFGNIAYSVLWTAIIVVSMSGVSFGSQGVIEEPINDLFGVSVIAASMHEAAHTAFPERQLDLGIGYTKATGPVQTFRWEGVTWTADLAMKRLLWVGVALGVAMLAALFFHRFDPARAGRRKQRNGWLAKALAALRSIRLPRLRLARRLELPALPLPAFARVLVAEMRMALRRMPWWWYAAALGLIIAGFNASGGDGFRGLMAVTWLWPVLIWSGLGVREKRHQTGPIVFSAPCPLLRQLPATWLAGVLVAALTGSGIALRLALDGAWAHLAAWGVGALFIPTSALALGIWSGSSKLFEALYVAAWYLGPLQGLAELDFMGVSEAALAANMPQVYAVATGALLVSAVVGRWRTVRG